MARRLKSVACVAAIALGLAMQSACRGAERAPDLSPAEAVGVAATVTASIYRALDDAAVQIYVARALASGAPVGDSEPCVTASNLPSHRASALAAPPFAESSIRQRERAVRVLGAYASLVAALAAAGPNGAPANAEFGAFERATFAFERAANAHAAGDLFVEDRAAELSALARRLRTAADSVAMKAVLATARPSVDALTTLVRADVIKRRTEAVAATHRAFSAMSGSSKTVALACGEPLVLAEADAGSVDPALWTVSSPNGVVPASSAGDDLQRRALALAHVDFDALFVALGDEVDAALASPPESSAIDAARRRYGAAAGDALRDIGPLLSAPS